MGVMELEAHPHGGGDSGGLKEKLVTSWFNLDKERKNGEQEIVREVLST